MQLTVSPSKGQVELEELQAISAPAHSLNQPGAPQMLAVGERHFASRTSFTDDLRTYGCCWGCTSEVGRLRSVLLRRPGPEIEHVNDPAIPRWEALMHPETAREQHDRLAVAYREHGVDVYYVETTDEDKPNALYCRDLLGSTPEGAIITRPAMAVRRGEERHVAETIVRLGVPIVLTINGTGTFEGADLLLADRRTAFVGWGNRTNKEGARQVIEELHHQGVDDITVVQVPYGVSHLDCMFAFASVDVVVVFPWMTPFIVCEKLLERGYRIVELNDPCEAYCGYAINFVTLEPGKILMPGGNPRSVEAIADAGIDVIEVDMSEITKGMGAIHCCSAFLQRDEI